MWANLGIFGGDVQDIAVDPQNPDRIFAATYMGRGLFLSQDGGASWQALEMENTLEGEDTFNEQSVYTVAVAPGNPDIIWVGHNYWLAKSTDGGQTWTHIANSRMQSDCATCGGPADAWRLCKAIAIDPGNPDVVYVGTGGPNMSDANGAVYGTMDGGSTWNKLNAGSNLDYRVEKVAVSPDNPSIVWAVTNSNGYGGAYDGTVYRSADSGQTFAPLQPKPATGGMLSIAPKPDNADIVFVTGGYGIVQLSYNGDEWAASYPVWDSRLASDVTFAPSNADVVYATWMRPSQYWGGDDLPKVSRGVFDNGAWTWETFVPDAQNATSFRCLAVHPANAEIVLGGDQSLGVLISRNHGQSWTPINEGLDAVIVYDVDVDGNNTEHMLAASGSGLYERADGVSAWIRRHIGIFRSAAFEPSSSTNYLGGGLGFVARTTNNGVSWAYSNSLGNVYVEDIAIDAANTNRVYITTGKYGRQVQRSTDGGATFQAVLDGVNQAGQAYSMNMVAIDPQNPLHLLAAGGNFYTPLIQGDLWESANGGDTWQRTGLTDTIVNAVIMDPRDPDIIYAGCGHSQNYVEPVVKSTDGGGTWETVTNGISPARRTLFSIWGPAADQLFAVGRYGYITRFDGSRWEVLESHTDSTLYGVHGISADDVYAVGGNGTIVHYDGQGWTAMTSNTSQTLYKVWGAGADDVYAVGQGGIILHYNGTAWTEMISPTVEDLYEIKGTQADNIFASGVGGTILHYNGSTWQSMASATDVTLNGLCVFSPSDVFAVGDDGVILRFNGSSWSALQSTVTGNLWGAWGDQPSNVFAAGPDGHLLHFDGQQWRQTDLNPANQYQEMWGVGQDTLFITGYFGEVWLYDGQAVTTVRDKGTYKRSVTDLAFHRSNPDIVYAATYGAGVYISPNQAADWLNLGTPSNSVYALATGSLYAATGSGMYKLTGTGVIAGEVNDAETLLGIDGAQVTTDLGNQCLSIEGAYMMVVPAGIFDLFAVATNYEMGAAEDITVVGSDVTRHDFALNSGSTVTPTGGGSGSSSSSSGGGGYCFIDTITP